MITPKKGDGGKKITGEEIEQIVVSYKGQIENSSAPSLTNLQKGILFDGRLSHAQKKELIALAREKKNSFGKLL